MKVDPVANYVVGRFKRLAQREARKPAPPRQIPPSEQVARFLAGTERYRVFVGEVTPIQYVEYERAMVKHLAESGMLDIDPEEVR